MTIRTKMDNYNCENLKKIYDRFVVIRTKNTIIKIIIIKTRTTYLWYRAGGVSEALVTKIKKVIVPTALQINPIPA